MAKDAADAALQVRLTEGLRWLEEEEPYQRMAPKGDEKLRSKMCVNGKQFEEYRDAGYLRFIKAQEAKGYARLFLVPEDAKKRWRVIIHTLSANSILEVGTKFKLPSVEEVKRTVEQGSWYAELDMSSWFSQFALHERVQKFFAIKKNKRDTFAHTRLPMGFRQACHIAQAATEALAAKSKRHCKVLIYIDNILFVGRTKEEVRDALKIFYEQCVEANATINGIAGAEDLEAKISREVTFLGMRFERTADSILVDITEKTRAKLELTADRLETQSTKRNFVALLSVLCFCSRVLGIKRCAFYNAIQAWRSIHPPGKEASEEDIADFWDGKIALSAAAKESIRVWVDEVKTMRRCTLRPAFCGDSYPAGLLITDASGDGWSGWHIDRSSEIKIINGKNTCASKHSSITEPWALFHAIKHLTTPESTDKIVLFSDNTGLVFGVNKGFAKSWAINRVISLIQERRPNIEIFAVHVPGEHNIADAHSRGLECTVDKQKDFVQWMGCLPTMVAKTLNGFVAKALPCDNVPYRSGIISIPARSVPVVDSDRDAFLAWSY